MTNKERFQALVSQEKSNVQERNNERIRNRSMLRESQKIALKILLRLDELKMSQAGLARKLGVTPQQITKIVSGKENLTLETQIKLQNLLNIPILASWYENKIKQTNLIKFAVYRNEYKYLPVKSSVKSGSVTLTKSLTLDYTSFINSEKAS